MKNKNANHSEVENKNLTFDFKYDIVNLENQKQKLKGELIMLTAPLFDIVESYRLERGYNMWTDGLEMDLIWIICEWN